MDELHVKVSDTLAGEIIKESGEYIFSYKTDDPKNFISLLMPVRKKDYVHHQLHPVFEMHLPEGYLLSIIKKHFSKFHKTDDFGLLKIMAPSIKARVTYTLDKENFEHTLTLEDLLHPKSETLFDELVHKFALRSALSGIQPKVLARVEDKATLKMEDYIVKSWGSDYPQLALNEYYCMRVVQQAGIPTPVFYLSDDDRLFIMKRFDKKEDGSYLGFEDMCVLMAKQREDKYEGTYEQIVKTIKIFVSPQHKKKSLLQFYKMTVLNFLLHNGDAHLKNFGLVYDGIEDICLAPAYDVVCTTVYIKNDIPALHLFGSKKWWDAKFLLRFGTQVCDLTPKEASHAYDECVTAVSTVAKDLTQRIVHEKSEEKKEFSSQLNEVFTMAVK
jgi:serine/threonine-protein kinase HipA